MIYRVVYSVRQRIPFIQVVRHEDLSLDPVRVIGLCINRWALDFTSRVGKRFLMPAVLKIRQKFRGRKFTAVKLDSRANLDNLETPPLRPMRSHVSAA